MRTVAVVPLRANSKGLPGKNVRPLAGKPLFMHAVACAHAAGIEEVYVVTDIEDILTDHSPAFTGFRRSAHSARDDAPTHEAVMELIDALRLQDRLIVLLQATSPLRSSKTVREVIKKALDQSADLACSVTEIDNSVMKSGTIVDGFLSPLVESATFYLPRQALPKLYKMDGGVYAFRADWLITNGSLKTDRIAVVRSDLSEVLDIDTMEDFELAEQRLGARTEPSGEI